jgi:hypothetical protein
MHDPDEMREVLREMIADGTLVEVGGELFIQDTRKRKKSGKTSPAEMIAGPLDGAKIHIETDSTHIVAFIGALWYVYARVGELDILVHVGSTPNSDGVDMILEE